MPVSRAHLCSIELLTQVDEGALKTLNKVENCEETLTQLPVRRLVHYVQRTR